MEESAEQSLPSTQFHKPIYWPLPHLPPSQPSGYVRTLPTRISFLFILLRTDDALLCDRPAGSAKHIILAPPLVSPLLLHNSASEVRDLLATERTFLSNLRLATYLAVVSVAIVVSFHLKSQPGKSERRASFPLGLVFALLSLTCLCMGVGNYLRTVEGYAKKKALVQTGVKTQIVLAVLGLVVVGTCFFFIGIGSRVKR